MQRYRYDGSRQVPCCTIAGKYHWHVRARGLGLVICERCRNNQRFFVRSHEGCSRKRSTCRRRLPSDKHVSNYPWNATNTTDTTVRTHPATSKAMSSCLSTHHSSRINVPTNGTHDCWTEITNTLGLNIVPTEEPTGGRGADTTKTAHALDCLKFLIGLRL